MGLPGTNDSGNGNKALTWLAGLLIPTLFGAALGWFTTQHRTSQAHAEDLAVLKAQMQDTCGDLLRINTKLDRLLEQKRTPRTDSFRYAAGNATADSTACRRRRPLKTWSGTATPRSPTF
jgi:hypothetical protein